jgi:dTMP kinase
VTEPIAPRAYFIVFEGPDGAGKSTQAALLADRLTQIGMPVIRTRQPGGDNVGKQLREILISRHDDGLSAEAELLLMMADRVQCVTQVIKPALAASSHVICDRYADSSIAYQGYGRGINLELIDGLNRFSTLGLVPDLTILLDIDPKIGLGRQAQKTRMELLDLPFHLRVRQGFLDAAQKQPDRYVVIDSTQLDVESVRDAVWKAYEAHYRHCTRA